ncbi:unnamed protein product [Moneuplotes crassus]|uniref:Uncharacterized protein n=1 Tax=Euplotes crassus TaxID=5936 RepID=A0AAD2DAJ0_EUPCR|nr:unnamed protein product [Moneuplotes crassus]
MYILPKCELTKSCDKIAYQVKRTEQNQLDNDIYVCENCVHLNYSGEPNIALPSTELIVETLHSVDFALKQMSLQMNTHRLDKKWNIFESELNSFKRTYRQFCGAFGAIQHSEEWVKMVQLFENLKDFLDRVYNFELMKSKRRKFHRNEFETGDILSSLAPEQGLEACLKQLSSYLETREIKCLHERLKEAKDEANERKEMIKQRDEVIKQRDEVIEQREEQIKESKEEVKEVLQEKHDLEHKLETLVEERQEQIQEKQKQEKTIEEMKETIQTLEKDALPSDLSYQELETIYNTLYGSKETFDESSEIEISANCECKDVILLKTLQSYKLPPLELVSLDINPTVINPETINRFLTNAFSSDAKGNNNELLLKTKRLEFNKDGDKYDSISEYMAGLLKAIPKISEYLGLFNFSVSSSEFVDLLVVAKDVKVIEFVLCKIKIDEECDFRNKLDDSSFEKIDFYGSGLKSNWKTNDYASLRSIIKGLSKVQSIKARPLTITLDCCGLNKQKAEEIIKTDCGMQNVTIEGI